jgi:plastocyanin
LALLTIIGAIAVGQVPSIARSVVDAAGKTARRPSAPRVLVAETAAPVAVAIVEPPLRPPPTWGYAPKVVTVKLGTKVTWTNNGAVIHTVTADGGGTFDSGTMAPQARFSFTPTAPGTFSYHCTYHPWMKGTMIVRP